MVAITAFIWEGFQVWAYSRVLSEHFEKQTLSTVFEHVNIMLYSHLRLMTFLSQNVCVIADLYSRNLHSLTWGHHPIQTSVVDLFTLQPGASGFSEVEVAQHHSAMVFSLPTLAASTSA